VVLEEPTEGEVTFEVDGIRLAIAGWAKAYAEGAIID
jgi:hypothetical protein